MTTVKTSISLDEPTAALVREAKAANPGLTLGDLVRYGLSVAGSHQHRFACALCGLPGSPSQEERDAAAAREGALTAQLQLLAKAAALALPHIRPGMALDQDTMTAIQGLRRFAGLPAEQET